MIYSITVKSIWEDFRFSWRLMNRDINLVDSLDQSEKQAISRLSEFLVFKNQWGCVSDILQMKSYGKDYIDHLILHSNIINDESIGLFYNIKIDLVGKGIFFGLGNTSYRVSQSGVNEPICAFMLSEIAPDYSIKEERTYFRSFFSLKLVKIDWTYFNDFLDFHFVNTFNNNYLMYRNFLHEVMSDQILEERSMLNTRLDNWINDNLKNTEESASKESNIKKTAPKELREILTEQGLMIYEWLVSSFAREEPLERILLIFALSESKLINNRYEDRNYRLVRNAIEQSIGTLGARQNFSKAKEKRDDYNNRVENIRLKIKEEISKKMVDKSKNS